MADSTPTIPVWLRETPIAHRGLHSGTDVPENSLAAFRAAVNAGYAIELDVRLLADGTVAVFHDPDLARLTGVAGNIEERASAEIADLRLFGTAEPIPSLADVLALVDGRVPLLIETKRGKEPIGALEDATLAALDGYTGLFAIQSFSAATVAYLAEHAPAVPRGQLAVNDDWYAEGAAPAFLGYNIDALPTPVSTRLRAQGLTLLAWTVRTEAQREKARVEADNIIFENVQPYP